MDRPWVIANKASEPRDAVEALHAREGGLLARASLFDLVADDVECYVLGSADELPWTGTFRGKDGVRRWMELLDEHLEYERFEPLELFADGDTVIEIVLAGGHARATGRSFESEVVRIWTFDECKAVRVRTSTTPAHTSEHFSRARRADPDFPPVTSRWVTTRA